MGMLYRFCNQSFNQLIKQRYHQDEPDTQTFAVRRYCGDIGYASLIHLSCGDKGPDSEFFAPVPLREVGSCVLGSTFYWYEIVPGVGTDAFTATCYMRNADSCGAPECSDTQLHVTGTPFLVKHTYTLADPKVRANLDLNGKQVTFRDRVATDGRQGGAKAQRGGARSWAEHDNGAAAARARVNNVASAGHDDTRASTYSSDGGDRGEQQQHAFASEASDAAPTTLPEDVWTGYSFIYSGYFEAISKKQRRSVGSGYFELVWPSEYYTLGNWTSVKSADLPPNALFVRRPYTLTLQHWNDDGREKGSAGEHGYESYGKDGYQRA